MTAKSEIKIDTTNAMARGGMLVSLNISVWEGRRKDKEAEGELADAKGAKSSKASSIHKHLFVDNPYLEAIKTFRGKARQWINAVSCPYDDSGWRFVPTQMYFNRVNPEEAVLNAEFAKLVMAFVNSYSMEVSKQAFQLGAWFNRDEYPTVDEVAEKFKFSISVRDVPQAGNLMVDVTNDVLAEIQERVNQQNNANIARVQADVWGRAKDMVERWHERMTAIINHNPDDVEETRELDENGNTVSIDIKKKRRPKLHDSMLDQGLELCQFLDDMNVTKDPALDEVRRALQRSLTQVDMPTLKKSPEMQASVQKQMQAIMDKFDF